MEIIVLGDSDAEDTRPMNQLESAESSASEEDTVNTESVPTQGTIIYNILYYD